MKKGKKAKSAATVTPVKSWEEPSPVQWQEVAPATETGTGLEQLWRTGSQGTEDGENPVMYGWFSVENLYFGDMELRLMPIQMKARAPQSAAPRKIGRFSLFYQADSCFRYAIPGEGAERA
jgi:hypothetical protein